MFSIIAKLLIKEGKIDQALALIKELMKDVAQEKGCLLYTLNRDKKNPNTLVFMERYQDNEALKSHGQTPYIKDFFTKLAELLDGRPEITIMEEVLSI